MQNSPANTNRLQFLDALRGIAAVTVMIAHATELLFPDHVRALFSYINLGHAAVTLFFFCSGFVIPISLEHSSLSTFWVRRFFRLYPLYWASIAIALCMRFILHIGAMDDPAVNGNFPLNLLVNLTLLQSLVGIPDLLGYFWTLGVEMQFYLMLSILYLCKMHTRTFSITIILLVGAAALQIILKELAGVMLPHNILLYIGLMFTGTCFYRYYAQQISRRQLLGIIALAMTCVATISVRYHALSYLTAVGSAFCVFGVFFILRARPMPSWLLYLGLISYSLYLLHALFFRYPAVALPPLLLLLLWCAVGIGVASITYWCIERPSIALGKKILRSKQKTKPAPIS